MLTYFNSQDIHAKLSKTTQIMWILHLDHKKHLQFLAELPLQVIHDFCKLLMDYLQKGANLKLYIAAAQKLEVEPESIQKSIESLVYLLMESVKHKLTIEEFHDLIISLGFKDEKEALLSHLYQTKQCEIKDAMTSIGFKLSEYYNMEWRFETQIASRTMLERVEPLVTVGFTLKNTDESNELKHIILQANATNLLHLTHELEAALEEERNQQIRKIRRFVK